MTEIIAGNRPSMNWAQTLFNPLGTSNKIEFTRAWTLLFFLQVGIVLGPAFTSSVIGLVGGDAGGLAKFGLYASPVVFILTTVCSYIIHTRRLRDARKSTLWAVLILLPLFLGLAAFVSSVSSAAQRYDVMYQERVEYVANPEAFEAKKAEERAAKAKEQAEQAKERREKAIAECEAARSAADSAEQPETTCAEQVEQNAEAQNRQRGRGNWGGTEPPAYRSPTPSQLSFVLEPNLAQIQNIIIPLSFFLAIWSLMWVARAPFIKAKVTDDEAFGKHGR